ncbi:efflux RND transporter permease subunit [Flocculibacter collagenilyticus]|uniref:efflux RND transporter permease subunit n=1 Tax=Flocculibacter collagenilyticus TaxID=2744479 RepID=UPI0018F7634D|nr:efflux RND transporter permease subunit [Flocculibacter collagenilyticus]
MSNKGLHKASGENESIGSIFAAFSLRKPITVTMVFLSTLLLGLVSSKLLPLEMWPGVDIPELFINVPYANSTPAEVERLITRPVEEALATISGIKRLRSFSRENGAEIGLEFAWDENINAKSIEAREKVDAIRHLLPDDVERVLVFQFNTSDMPILQLRISSDRDLSLAYDLLERNLRRPIERVAGVSRVTMYGVHKREISIELNPEKVSSHNINTADLAAKMAEYNFSMNAGHIYESNRKVQVKPVGQFQSIEEVEDIIVAQGVRLKDIATVSLQLPELEEGRHLDQTYAVGLEIFKESSANLVSVAQNVIDVIDEAGKSPQFNGINLFLMQNTADGVTTSLSNLIDAGLIGALLSIVVLYLFLRNITTTLIVVLSVPVAIFITLGAMYLLGYSLNLLSLMGLMLAIGMLVDNAVVITESIMQERTNTSDPVIATKKGVNNVSLAVISGTLTTAIVFLPNIIGKKIDVTIFLEHMAIAICISLLASLIIAQTLIPLLLSKFAPSNIKVKEPKHTRLNTGYYKSLDWVLNNQKKTLAIAFAMLFSIAIPMSLVSGDEEASGSNDRLFLSYNINGNYTLEEVEKTISVMETYLYANQDEFYIDSVYSYFRPDFGMSTLNLKKDLDISISEIKDRIKANWPTLVRAEPQFGWGNSNGGGVRLTLTGNSTNVLLEIADNLVPSIESLNGFEDVRTDMTSDQKELQVTIDRTAAHRINRSTQEIAQLVSMSLRGMNLRTYRDPDMGEIRVKLNFDKTVKESLATLKQIPILKENGAVITLDKVATFNIVPKLNEIRRMDRQTGLDIGANLREDFTIEQARDALEQLMSQVTLPHGYSWSLDGSFKRQDEAQAVMYTNMLLAVAMIYIVMAALFESLILPTAVITSLIFSIVGVFWAFLITGTPMSVMGMIGILILMGIVVNNGLVLIDRINQFINQGMEMKQAILDACNSRIRPILMTVSTTILGMVPLAMGSAQMGGEGPAYAPLAIAIIGGLLFSTLTSLFLVPLSYVLLLKLSYRTQLLFKSSRQIATKVIKPC